MWKPWKCSIVKKTKKTFSYTPKNSSKIKNSATLHRNKDEAYQNDAPEKMCYNHR